MHRSKAKGHVSDTEEGLGRELPGGGGWPSRRQDRALCGRTASPQLATAEGDGPQAAHTCMRAHEHACAHSGGRGSHTAGRRGPSRVVPPPCRQQLTEEELERLEEACDMALELNASKHRIYEYVESRMSFIAPNLSIIIGASTAAKIMGEPGGRGAVSSARWAWSRQGVPAPRPR